ncbi:MAG TPA: S53 family peptidase [Ktedonobacteraceae bacterium]|nr:S53 family peptidase [Ktedonobacteraceae bacterium]
MHKKIQGNRQGRLSILLLFSILLLLVSACSAGSGGTSSTTTPAPKPTLAATSNPALDICPSYLSTYRNCFTPHALRVAYGVESLTEKGFTGKGMTVIDIVSYGSPTLQQDMDAFDQQFNLPHITIQVIAPLGTVAFNPNDANMTDWAEETELDVQIIHAIAPDAGIIVMTSPVAETEGTIGLPQFLQLEQYAVNHHLGQVFSQSYVASEATLADSASQQFVQSYANFYKQITTQDGFTVVSGSGDNGATDWQNIAATQLAPRPTINFPADVPWVTAVGGTTLLHSASGNGYEERAWSGSGGGMSTFFSEPDYQRSMPQAAQSELAGHRGIPDIAADADPYTGMAFYFNGQWTQTGGTSASTPFWAAIVAIADQMAGHPLGFINPGIYKVAASQHYSQDLRDITAGSNGVAKVSVQGFQAVKGWDAVTGWGSPQASTFIPDLIAALK